MGTLKLVYPISKSGYPIPQSVGPILQSGYPISQSVLPLFHRRPSPAYSIAMNFGIPYFWYTLFRKWVPSFETWVLYSAKCRPYFTKWVPYFTTLVPYFEKCSPYFTKWVPYFAKCTAPISRKTKPCLLYSHEFWH